MFVVAPLVLLPAGWIIVSKLTRRSNLGDSDWQYVELRRVFAYIEPSLDPNLRWVVFEPNEDLLQRARLLPLCPRCPP